MLRINMGDRTGRYCDGLSRRSFLQIGALGATSLALPEILSHRAQATAEGKATKATSVIMIWLDGGPTHVETYDPKPDAPEEYRGPLKTAKTNVPGILLPELLPRHAAIMDKLAILRSMHHTTGDHFEGAHWMLTGYKGSNAVRMDPMYPSAGSYAAKLKGPNQPGLPAYVAVPIAASVGLVPGYNSAAYLGSSFNPFQTGGDPNQPNFSVRNLTLPNGVTMAQLEDRNKLRYEFDKLNREAEASGMADSIDKFQMEAFEMISGPRARKAFDLTNENPRLRDRYGRHNWAQSCLLARRLVEHGVTFVTVHMGGWDDHGEIEKAMQNKLPIIDNAIATLVEDLDARGLYETTAICVCGEFGRTPKVNETKGRDHWGQAMSVLMGGGGIKGGTVVGSTTAKAEYPKDRPLDPEDMLATLYKVLGIDSTKTFTDSSGRPHPILAKGKPIAELI